MGVAVTILEVAPRALGPLDEVVAARVVAMTRALGVTVREGVRVEAVERADGRLRVRGVDGEVSFSVDAELAVNAAGRAPAVADLDLSAGGLELDERGLPKVHASGRSVSDPRVVFAGDALPGTPQLSPLATVEGRAAWDALAGHGASAVDLGVIPSAVFTVPPVAMVGLTAVQAQRAGLSVEVKDNDTASWRSHRTYGDEVGFARVTGGSASWAESAPACSVPPTT
jgi:glutathione reductase (NADPH)